MSRDFENKRSIDQVRNQHLADKLHAGLFGIAALGWAGVAGSEVANAGGLNLDVNAIMQSPNKLLAVGSAVATLTLGCVTTLQVRDVTHSGQELAVREAQVAELSEQILQPQHGLRQQG